MPIVPQVLDDLANAGANIVINAATASQAEVTAVFNLWARAKGNVTIRNAGLLPPNAMIQFAKAFGGRVTFEE